MAATVGCNSDGHHAKEGGVQYREIHELRTSKELPQVPLNPEAGKSMTLEYLVVKA